jgi:hypothetical protein
MKEFTTAMFAMMVEQSARTGEQVSAWGARLATWLLVGNAGALALAIQALREPASGRFAELAFHSGRTFAGGLVLAFVGAVLAYWSVIWTRSLQSKAIDIVHAFAHTAAVEDWNRQRGKPLSDSVLEAQGKEMQAQADKITELQRRMRTGPNRVAVVSLVVLAASSVAFAFGMIGPLVHLRPQREPLPITEMIEAGKLVSALTARPKAAPSQAPAVPPPAQAE